MDNIKDITSLKPKLWSVTIKYFDSTYIDEKNPDGQVNTVIWGQIPSDCTEEEIESYFREHFFKKYLEKKEKPPADIMSIDIIFKGEHRWWLTWFAHETNQ